MDSDIQKIIETQIALMPKSVKDAIKEIHFTEQIRSIAQKNGLRIDQAGVVETETMLTLLGLEHPDAFVKNLTKEGALSSAQAEVVARDVNEIIFKNIKHALVEMSGGIEAEKPTPSTPSTETMSAAKIQDSVARVMPNDIAKTKLEQSFRIPPQTTTVTLPQTQAAVSTPQTRPQSGFDPYREPIA